MRNAPRVELAPTLSVISPDALREAETRAAYAYWTAKANGRAMPAPGDIDPAEIPRLLTHSLMVDVIAGPPRDFLYAIAGETVSQGMNINPKGQRASALFADSPPDMIVLHERLHRVCELRAPICLQGGLQGLARKFSRRESVALPLSREGSTVGRIWVLTMFNLSGG